MSIASRDEEQVESVAVEGVPAVPMRRVGVWTGALDALPMAEAREAAAEIEALGYGALWLPEAVGRDPLVAAAFLLDATTTITIASGIAGVYSRDPMAMAAAHKTLTEAAPGRFLLGLGVSHQPMVERMRGASYDKPLSYMRDYLAAMDSAPFAAVGPAARPPRVLAALGPRMLALAAEQADGAHPYFQTPDHTGMARMALGPGKLLAPEQMVVLDPDADSARAKARVQIAVYLGLPNYTNNLRRFGFGDDDFAAGGSDRLVDAIVAWGDIDAITKRVEEHLAAGADHVAVQVLTGDYRTVPRAEWRKLAPALRDL